MEESLLGGANRKHLGSASFTTTLAAIVSFRRNSSRTIGRRISRFSRRRERAGGRANGRALARWIVYTMHSISAMSINKPCSGPVRIYLLLVIYVG